MTDDLTTIVADWATEIARSAADLPSRQARESYLAERHNELMAAALAEGASEDDAVVLAETCLDTARRITIGLLAQRDGATG